MLKCQKYVNEVRTILQTGMILKGRYCIVEKLGSGGQGSLYLARDLNLGVMWAVKEIPQKQKREAKLLRLLDHPALPRMIDYLEREESVYLVMEYIRGRSLGEHLRRGRVFTIEEIIRIGISVTQVLGYLHHLTPPVYYGDLKPENLMLTETNHVYLVDFGAAVFAYDERRRESLGTRGFAAPEQYEGKVGKESDVYGLGRTLWALLGKRQWRLLQNPLLLKILIRCCQKNPAWRYPDMSSVEAALKKARGWKWASHGKFLLGMLLSGGIFLLLGMALLSAQQPFEEALAQVTELYYEEAYLEKTEEEKLVLGKETEEQLRSLLKQYGASGEERRLLLMLAQNAELMKEQRRAALYYEQLLLYEGGYRPAYGEYGCFLLRMGQEKAARALFADYKTEEDTGQMEEETSANLAYWCGLAASETASITPSRNLMGLQMGGFDLQVGTGDEDWWEDEETLDESQAPTPGGEATSQETEGEGGSATNTTQPSGGSAGTSATGNASASSAGQSTGTQGESTSGTISQPSGGNTGTSSIGNASASSAGQSTGGQTGSSDSSSVGQSEISQSLNSDEAEGQPSANQNEETSLSNQENEEQKSTEATSSESGSVETEATEHRARILEMLKDSAAKAPFLGALAADEVYESVYYNKKERLLEEQTSGALRLSDSEAGTELDIDKVTETDSLAEPEDSAETVFSPSYYEEEAQSTEQYEELQMTKLTASTDQQGFLHLTLQSPGPVHIWSIRLNGQECLWNWEEDGVLLHTKAEENQNTVICLAFYEKKMSPPALVLS
jgi:hypothetical protein